MFPPSADIRGYSLRAVKGASAADADDVVAGILMIRRDSRVYHFNGRLAGYAVENNSPRRVFQKFRRRLRLRGMFSGDDKRLLSVFLKPCAG